MKPPPFAYEDPTEVADAVRLLDVYGSDAKVLAGGQSLVPLLNFQLTRPKILIDINQISSLRKVFLSNETLHIGAMSRQSAIENDPDVGRLWPIVPEVIAHIGHPQIRNRGTIGGSLVHNDPAAELPATMVALDAEMTVVGPHGARKIPAEEFFVETLTTALAPNELLTSVTLPTLPPGTGWGFTEVARRHGDFSIVAVVVVLFSDSLRGKDARIVITGIGEGPSRIRTAEGILIQGGFGDEALMAAAAAVRQEIEPEDDIHAPAWYRRKVAETLTLRAFRQAVQRLAG